MSKTSNSQTLLERARCFEMEALAEIYDRYSPGLYRYAFRLLGEAGLAEECVAETFSRFLHAMRAGGGPDDQLQAYLYRVAHNWATDVYRRQPPPPLELTENLALSEEMQTEPRAVEQLLQARMRAAIQRLTADQRQVILLKYIEGWKNEQVAAALHKPVGAVKALQHRALETLRHLLIQEERYESRA